MVIRGQLRDEATGDAREVRVNGIDLELRDAQGAALIGDQSAHDVVSFTDAAVSVNSTTTLATKISGTCPALIGGSYRVSICYGWAGNAAASDFFATFAWDGAALTARGTGELHRQEPKDPQGNDGADGVGTTQSHAFSKFYLVTVAAGATPTVLLQFASEAGGTEVGIWDAVVLVERIGP